MSSVSFLISGMESRKRSIPLISCCLRKELELSPIDSTRAGLNAQKISSNTIASSMQAVKSRP
ncbi:hypothetical protein [Bacillus testis]|uniref:hypothetical protein n=1 Tax=Bacillus testis TaxID=1622072 RepID=UPI0011C9773F|nr:hypothetical protein [Bacillus testis]